MTAFNSSHWCWALTQMARYYRVALSPETLALYERAGAASDYQQLATVAGLQITPVETAELPLEAHQLPAIVAREDGRLAIITHLTAAGHWQLEEADGTRSTLDPNILGAGEIYWARPQSNRPDARVDTYLERVSPHWLRERVFDDWRPYTYVMLASFTTNLLALAGVIFSMQVYDRVIPAQSLPTLYVLFGGVLLATLFAFLLRQARTRLIDLAAKKADLRISAHVFSHALNVKNALRPRATGTFINQLRELEQVRDMLTSGTVAALVDIPFFILFALMFAALAGELVWVPLVAMVLLLAPGVFAQRKMARLAKLSMRESALRSAMLVEAVQGMEDIKLLQAETAFSQQWNHLNSVNADASLQLRDLTQTLNNWSQTLQGGVFVLVVCVGAPMVMSGAITTGVLVAASILSSRMLAPLNSVAQLLNRWQQAHIASDSLDKLLALAVDQDPARQALHLPAIRGAYDINDACFAYTSATDAPSPIALSVARLTLAPGERVAILGRNGAGKSTLLQALAGLIAPERGSVLLDGVALGLIDTADVRRDIAYLSQQARLFHGSIRDNLALGAPGTSDAQMLALLEQLGAADLVQRQHQGLDYVIAEGGLGLSGGQRQALLLARLLLRQPKLLLLDEPTAALDEASEARVIAHLAALPPSTGLVIATHRLALLALVTRVIVIDQGQIVVDGPRDQVLARLGATPTGRSTREPINA